MQYNVNIIVDFKYIHKFISVLSANTGKYGPGNTPHLDTFHAMFEFYKYFNTLMHNLRKWSDTL